MHITMSITIDRPVSEVFAYIADSTNSLEWQPDAVDRRKTSDGPIGLGTRFEATDRAFGRDVSHSQEVVAYEQDRLVRTRMSEPWNGEYEIVTEPTDGGTRLSIDVTGEPTGIWRLFRLFPSSLMRGSFERDYARLKAVLEAREND